MELGDGRSHRFTIQVTNVLRGDRSARVDVNDVISQPCSGYLTASMGDRIALALDATAFSPAVEANGAAWLIGRPPDGFVSTTIEDVFKLAGVPMPAPAAAAPLPDATPLWLGPAVWGLAVALVLVVVGIVGRRVSATR
jgi:hypothetical protein